MKILRPFLGILALVFLFTASACVSSSGGKGGSASLADSARYLAGLPGSPRNDLALPRSSPEWKAHAERMDALWNRLAGRKNRVSHFRGEIGGLASPGVLFYPFGGPDYIYASTLFPGANTYVLVGLEGVETMPDLASLSAPELARGLGGISKALRTITEASYFVTTEMRADLSSTALRGTLPLLLTQIAREGKSVSSVEAVSLDSAGHLIPRSAGSACPGWHIRAGNKDIFYFQKDLSNRGLSDRRLLHFVSSQGAPVTFVKSASYLMHHGEFSVIRDYIVSQSRGLVQCPSGVPYRHLTAAGWKLKLYGNYQGAKDPFTQYAQPDLAAAYAQGTHPVKPMSFGFGYLYEPHRTCLIVGHR